MRIENKTFQKALALLLHPSSLIAIFILFLNDHILRVFWPSWLTGKIGDFAWLYFIPFAFAAVISVLFPKTGKRQSDLVPLLSYGFVLSIFALANTWGTFQDVLIEITSRVLQTPIRVTRDPGDLVALVALLPSYLSWQQFKPREDISYQKGIAVLSMCAVLTIANSGVPDIGIACFKAYSDRIIAGTSAFDFYTSRDGGLTWEKTDNVNSFDCYYDQVWEKTIQAPENTDVLFRKGEKGGLEESENGGKSWIPLELDMTASQAEIIYYQKTQQKFYQPGPLDAVLDPETNNLIFAMGLEGVLVRKPTGEWLSVSIDEYARHQMTIASIPGLLNYEIFLGLQLLLLVFLTPRGYTDPGIFQKILLTVTWGAWGITVVALKPALLTGYDTVLGFMEAVIISIILIAIVIVRAIRSWEKFKKDLASTGWISLSGFAAFITPYFLWAFNLIHTYQLGMIFAVILSAGILAASFVQYVKPRQEYKTR